MDAQDVTCFYLHTVDLLILNSSHKYFEHYKSLLETFLEIDDLGRKQICYEARRLGMTFFDFINRIIRIRKKLSLSKEIAQ